MKRVWFHRILLVPFYSCIEEYSGKEGYYNPTGNDLARVSFATNGNIRVFVIEENGDSRYDIGYKLGKCVRGNMPGVVDNIKGYLEMCYLYFLSGGLTPVEVKNRARAFESILKNKYKEEIQGFAVNMKLGEYVFYLRKTLYPSESPNINHNLTISIRF